MDVLRVYRYAHRDLAVGTVRQRPQQFVLLAPHERRVEGLGNHKRFVHLVECAGHTRFPSRLLFLFLLLILLRTDLHVYVLFIGGLILEMLLRLLIA